MRNGSVAIVPLLLGIFTLFWFIWFLGGSSDTLHRVNNVENLQHLQERLLLSAAKYRFEYERANPGLTDDEYEAVTDIYIDNMMVNNKIQE